MTLTEIIMVTVLASALLLYAGPLLKNIRRFFALNSAKTLIQREARDSMAALSRGLRAGTSSSVVIDQAAGEPPYSRIAFQKLTGEQCVFYQRDNEFRMVVANKETILSKHLHSFIVTLPRSSDLSSVTALLSLEREYLKGQFKAYTLTSERIRLMNE
jgi:hypothetical protein